MSVTLITGPHQSGKSRRLWQRLRAEPAGAAVLVRPNAGIPHDLVRQVYAWSGPGLLPPIWSFCDLVERCVAASDHRLRVLANGPLTHVLRTWAVTHLRGPWSTLARCRATGRELAELVRRLDDHGITTADIILAQRGLRERGDVALCDSLSDVLAARAYVDQFAKSHALTLPGTRLRLLAESAAAPNVAAIYLDDFQTFSPAELMLLRSLSQSRTVVIAAVSDPRLGLEASPADRLRSVLLGAEEERLPAIAAQSPHALPVRAFLSAALEEGRTIDAAGVDHYRYRDSLHAGRAMAAWLRRHQVEPAQALLVVRVADAEALAVADALIAAGVPVSGRFQLPFLGTSVGGSFAALATFCREQTWGAFLGLVERLAHSDPPVVRLADLRGPWSHVTLDEGMKRAASLAADGTCDDWGWSEPDRRRPWLQSAMTWLVAWRERVRVEGTWWQRLVLLAEKFDLSDGGSGVLRTLAELAALHPVSSEDLDELLGAARVTVERDHGKAALEITDAVRGRTWPRSVVLIHDLEHGRWPTQTVGGALLPPDERRHLAALFARDVYDEAGRNAGEIGAFLAVAARANQHVVLGIPCGDREPCAWLGTLADQLGWDLESLREDAGGEAVPGAPLGMADAQGAHEQALWSVTPGSPHFSFVVPPRLPADLRLKASALSALFRDSFATVCDRLCLADPLANLEFMDEGNDLHALLAKLVVHPPSQWSAELNRLLPEWIATSDDALTRIERNRLARRLSEVMMVEAVAAAQTARQEAEVPATIPLHIPGHPLLQLKGRIDRLDRLADGRVRLIDYKRGAISAQAKALAETIDGQLLGYLLGARAAGWDAECAYYLSLRAGARAGWGTIPTPIGKSATKDGSDLADLDRVAGELGKAIAELSAGIAHADADGRSASNYAPIARLDERRLDLGGESET